MKSDARQVSTLAPYGMRNMREDKLEGCLGEEISSGDGEDDDLAGMEVLCDILQQACSISRRRLLGNRASQDH